VAECPGTIPERSLGDLLNETFLVYGRHFWLIVGIVAVVNVPALVVAFILGTGPAGYVVEAVRGTFGSMYVYAALAFAVGQGYVTGDIEIGRCYHRVWSRVLSLSMLMFALLASAVLLATLMFLLARTVILPFVLIVPALMMAVYLTVAVPALATESFSWFSALKRSFHLVQESWWRVFAIISVVILVTMGLAIVVMIPFFIVGALAGLGGANVVGSVTRALGGIAVAVVAVPVPSIAGTLLYYDLRVRKEGFDMPSLSREMGVVAV